MTITKLNSVVYFVYASLQFIYLNNFSTNQSCISSGIFVCYRIKVETATFFTHYVFIHHSAFTY